MKVLNFLALSLLLSLNCWATADWRTSAIPISEDPFLQQQVDEIMEEIFQTNLKDVLCGIYKNPISASHALGISKNTAQRIYEHCPEGSSPTMTKILEKKYYLSFANPPGLDSWTDLGNRTYIFADESLDRNRLKMILLHEMAIATDAKTNMLLSTYFTYRDKEHSQVSNSLQIITMDNLTPQEESLKQAFNWSTWKPLSLTFATLRAFNLERYVQKISRDKSHKNCVAEFKTLFPTITDLPKTPTSSEVDQIAEMIADLSSRANAPTSPEHEAQILDFLMSEKLQLHDAEDNKMTFCQFMTQPLLTGKSLYSFFSNGPRPRLTGGTGGQGGGKLDSQRTKDIPPSITAPLKTTAPSSSDRDRLQEVIQKLKETHPFRENRM